jgi:hypothetical protein
MELWKLKCKICKYATHVLTGTSESDQTFSDLNEDFSYYRVYECANDKTLLSINVWDSEFFGKCPEHETKLHKLKSLPESCPKCNSKLEAAKLEMHPLEESERPRPEQ